MHGIFPAKVLEWVAMPSSRDLPDTGIEPMSPALQVNTVDPLGELKKPLATAPHVRLRCVPMCVYTVLASAGSVAVVC